MSLKWFAWNFWIVVKKVKEATNVDLKKKKEKIFLSLSLYYNQLKNIEGHY